MTIPSDLLLPFEGDRIVSGDPQKLASYMSELRYSLVQAYQNLSQNINGFIEEYPPVLFGETSPGAGNYSIQTGWYIRRGIMVDYWFDVAWSAHTGTGNFYVQLPYVVKFTSNFPFVGQVHMSGIALPAGYTNVYMIGISNGAFAALVLEGSGQPLANLSVIPSGRLLGHIRYIGQEFA